MKSRIYIIAVLISLFVGMVTASDWPMKVFLGVPKALYDAHPAKRQKVTRFLWQLSDTPAHNAWADSGWKAMYRGSDTSDIWMVYCVTEYQIRQQLTPAKIQRIKDFLDDHPAVKVTRNTSLLAVMEQYDLHYLED